MESGNFHGVNQSLKGLPISFPNNFCVKVLAPQGSTKTWMLANKCMNTDSIAELSKQ